MHKTTIGSNMTNSHFNMFNFNKGLFPSYYNRKVKHKNVV